MKTPISQREWEELPPRVRKAYAPLKKASLGLAFAVYFGALILLVTAYHLLLDDFLLARIGYLADYEYSGSKLWLLENYFFGYNPETWGGAFIGMVYGFVNGFVVGWCLAFGRNFFIASWLFVVRVRENLTANRGFLDKL